MNNFALTSTNIVKNLWAFTTELTTDSEPLKEIDLVLVGKKLEHIEDEPLRVLNFYFLDGMEFSIAMNV